MIAFRLSKRIGDRRIDIAVEAQPGITALFGPSGTGKTSLLNMVAGLLRPDAGRIAIDGDVLFDSDADIDRPPEERHLGYVFQDRRLFPHLSVRGNLAYGGPLDAHIVDLLGLGGLLDRWPRHLSGGEAQRVALGRALLSKPRALLLDEPLSHLDRARAEEITALILRLRDELALPMLYVTHDADEIAALGARRIDLAQA